MGILLSCCGGGSSSEYDNMSSSDDPVSVDAPVTCIFSTVMKKTKWQIRLL